MKKLSLLLSVILFQSALAFGCEDELSPERSSLFARGMIAAIIARKTQNYIFNPGENVFTDYAATNTTQDEVHEKLDKTIKDLSSKCIAPKSIFQVFTPDRRQNNHMEIKNTSTGEFFDFSSFDLPEESLLTIESMQDRAQLHVSLTRKNGTLSFQGMPNMLHDIENCTGDWYLWQTAIPPKPMTGLNPFTHCEKVTQIVQFWTATSDEHDGSPRLG